MSFNPGINLGLSLFFSHVFRIRDSVVPYFNNEIREIAKSLSKNTDLSKIDFDLMYGIVGEVTKEKREAKIYSWVERHLPELSIEERNDWSEKEKPSTDFIEITNHNCVFCDRSEPEDKDDMKNWDKFFSTFENICAFHRLLFKIGKAQRMVNSTVKNSGQPLILAKEFQRKVIAVSRLDLNSLGILFKTKYCEDADNNIDLRRRRSIRFNSQWWCLVKDILDDEDSEIDRIVSWVAAGDDLVLADYTATIGPVKTKLHDILEKLSEGLVGLSSSEYGDFKITFGAGISERKGSISCTMEDSWKKEKMKEIWKQEMRDKNQG